MLTPALVAGQDGMAKSGNLQAQEQLVAARKGEVSADIRATSKAVTSLKEIDFAGVYAEQDSSSGSKLCASPKYVPAKKVQGKFYRSQKGEFAKSLEMEGDTTISLPDKIKINTYKTLPDVGLKVDGGWLLGTDKGEWLGDLVILDEQGNQSKLLDVNVKDLFRIENEIVAIVMGVSIKMVIKPIPGSSMSGMYFIDRGVVYLVAKNEDGIWRADKWETLQCSPRSAFMLEDGRVLVVCDGEGVVISANRKMEKFNCD